MEFKTFKQLWIEQEVNSVESCDKEQLIEELEECRDFNELYRVIGLWSSVPYKERIENFIQRNTSYDTKYQHIREQIMSEWG